MSHPRRNITRASTQAAAKAVVIALGDDMPYTIVGGCACRLLDGQRLTNDIDAAGTFTIEPRTRHTQHAATGVDIDVRAPAALFRGAFDAGTVTVAVDGVRVLHPRLLLDAKASNGKKITDGADIAFLLRYICDNGVELGPGDVPNASGALIAYTVERQWVSQDLWVVAGFGI
ncbi:hypothetical protein TRAPUB_5360 [Trametes pubescens]|uniref:Uncharacterized protein n=1 Tax=Trametes pubescens TaxID=154538 RepID=A0A1M2V8R7_TRAPU|nr:hypothetical protein TRAPUB_5360 [Trametes pubescens]